MGRYIKFFGNGVVWDPLKNKKLCEFKNGIFETSDQYVIEILNKKYKFDIIQNNIAEPILPTQKKGRGRPKKEVT